MRIWSALLLVLATAGRVRAQEAPAAPASEPRSDFYDRAVITGSLRAGYWTSARDLGDGGPVGAGMVWLKASRRLSSRVSFVAEGWAAGHSPDNSDGSAQIREAYVAVHFADVDLRAGRQIIAWGRADGINPTDLLSGQDYRLLTADDTDRRLGTTAVRVSRYVGGISISAVWLPEFRGDEFVLPPPPPGVGVVRDDRRWRGTQWALRAEQTGRAVDWAVSYVHGTDMAPDLGVTSEARPGIRLSHHPIRAFGADMAANLGRFGLRAEGAYVETADSEGRDPFTKNPYLFIVGGADRTFDGLLNLNVQYIFRYVRKDPELPDGVDFASLIATQQAIVNNQTQRVQHGASFRIAYSWFNETLEAECAAAGYAQPSGGTMRPKVTYAVTDHWKAIAGAEIFRGEPASAFGLLRRNTAGYFEVRWSF